LPLPNDEELFSLLLDPKWVMLVQLEVHILVLGETESRQQTRIASRRAFGPLIHPCYGDWLIWEALGHAESITR
jgi:hypothetical protein